MFTAAQTCESEPINSATVGNVRRFFAVTLRVHATEEHKDMLVQELRDLLLRILPFTSFGTYPPFRAGCFHSTTHFNLAEWKGPSDITQRFCAKLLPFLSQFHTVKTPCGKNDLPSPRCLLNRSEYCIAKVIFSHSRIGIASDLKLIFAHTYGCLSPRDCRDRPQHLP